MRHSRPRRKEGPGGSQLRVWKTKVAGQEAPQVPLGRAHHGGSARAAEKPPRREQQWGSQEAGPAPVCCPPNKQHGKPHNQGVAPPRQSTPPIPSNNSSKFQKDQTASKGLNCPSTKLKKIHRTSISSSPQGKIHMSGTQSKSSRQAKKKDSLSSNLKKNQDQPGG